MDNMNWIEPNRPMQVTLVHRRENDETTFTHDNVLAWAFHDGDLYYLTCNGATHKAYDKLVGYVSVWHNGAWVSIK